MDTSNYLISADFNLELGTRHTEEDPENLPGTADNVHNGPGGGNAIVIDDASVGAAARPGARAAAVSAAAGENERITTTREISTIVTRIRYGQLCLDIQSVLGQIRSGNGALVGFLASDAGEQYAQRRPHGWLRSYNGAQPSALKAATGVMIQAMVSLHQFSCHKLLSKEPPQVPNFHCAALIGHLGGVHALLELLSEIAICGVCPRVTDVALHVLWNLSAFAENKPLVVRSGGVQVLCNLVAELRLCVDVEAAALAGDIDWAVPTAGYLVRRFRRACATILHNICESVYRNGEHNPVQQRIVEEGGLQLVLSIGRAARASTPLIAATSSAADEVPEEEQEGEAEVMILCALAAAHLTSHPSASQQQPIPFNEAAAFLHEVASCQVALDPRRTPTCFDAWLCLIPFVPLLESHLVQVRVLTLQALSRMLIQEKYQRKFWRDLALVNGIGPLRKLAEGTDDGHDSNSDEVRISTASGDTSAAAVRAASQAHSLSLRQQQRDLATKIMALLKVQHRTAAVQIPPDTLGRDLGKIMHSPSASQPVDVPTSNPASPVTYASGGLLSSTSPASPPPFSDVTFSVGSGDEQRSFPAHRVILAARVPALAPMLHVRGSNLQHDNCKVSAGALAGSPAWSEATSGSAAIALPSTSPAGFHCLLEWAYTGSAARTLFWDTAVDALVVADMYGCDQLHAMAQAVLAQGISAPLQMMQLPAAAGSTVSNVDAHDDIGGAASAAVALDGSAEAQAGTGSSAATSIANAGSGTGGAQAPAGDREPSSSVLADPDQVRSLLEIATTYRAVNLERMCRQVLEQWMQHASGTSVDVRQTARAQEAARAVEALERTVDVPTP